MGLDMYLFGDDYIPTFDGSKRPERDGFPVSSYRLDMGYWRKHAPLHRHIVDTYAKGEDNCREIPLSEEELLAIADVLRRKALPKDEDCNGFFFGNPDMWSDDRKAGDEYAATFERAAAWLSRGDWRSVYYQASW